MYKTIETFVSYIINKNRENFKNDIDLSKFSWAVDEKDDLSLVQKIVSRVNHEPILINDVLTILENEPKIFEINFQYFGKFSEILIFIKNFKTLFTSLYKLILLIYLIELLLYSFCICAKFFLIANFLKISKKV